jgi:hypothetical protein
MPNTLTNVQDIKVAQRALQPFTAALTPMRAFSTNFSPDPAEKLDTVRVPFVGTPTQSSDFAGNYTARRGASCRGTRSGSTARFRTGSISSRPRFAFACARKCRSASP